MARVDLVVDDGRTISVPTVEGPKQLGVDARFAVTRRASCTAGRYLSVLKPAVIASASFVVG